MASQSIVHVFGIIPGSKGEEEGYSYPFWEPEPGDDVSEEEFEKWEDRNPIWGLRTDLGCYLDQDFVEYFTKGDREVWEYIATYIRLESDITSIRESVDHCNEFVLIFREALGNFSGTLKSTEYAIYAGEYSCTFSS